jgi:hypothetical protein
MLKEIIHETLSQMEEDGPLDSLTETITADVKNLAKKLFFEGKVNDLKDFIFDIKNENNPLIEKHFIEHISLTQSRDFIMEFKRKIQHEVEQTGREKNIISLLEVLDYGHLKGFLSMFKL